MRVIIESPLAGDYVLNMEYAQEALHDSLMKNESPFASHMIYPMVLDDNVPDERAKGMAAGWEWMTVADKVAVYSDLGISNGMKRGIARAQKLGLTIEYRKIR